ncbi:peptidylprolyl isomerase [Microlunatus sp. GCM10028923]|uniref:peptidylprolyl isomerase n=1 Tax=Microlunatus sp. GCM10028923 TaxID=3273400 RepID=UPI00361E3327
MRRFLRGLVVMIMVAAVSAIAPPAQAEPQPPPGAEPTQGACGFAQLADQTYSTWVGLPPDPRRTPDRGTMRVTLRTEHGDVRLELDRSLAPCTVQSFLFLLHQKYFDGTSCHRLTAYRTPPAALSVLQCGDPLGTGWGDPGYSFADELDSAQALDPWPGTPDRRNYRRGTLAMANAGPDTNGSQFFLVYSDSRLRPDYTVFGRVTEQGLAVLDKIAAGGIDPGAEGTPEDGAPALGVTIERAKLGR